jgi:hypothetical protein
MPTHEPHVLELIRVDALHLDAASDHEKIYWRSYRDGVHDEARGMVNAKAYLNLAQNAHAAEHAGYHDGLHWKFPALHKGIPTNKKDRS